MATESIIMYLQRFRVFGVVDSVADHNTTYGF